MANLTNSTKLIEEMSKKVNTTELAAVAKSGNSDDVTEGSTHKFVTANEKTVIGNTSGTNTGDETTATIKNKLGITTLSGSNTGDETAATIKTKLGISTLSGSNTGDETTTTIKTKLGKASTTQDGYLSKEDYNTFFSAISGVYKYKGTKASVSELPASGNTTGDVRNTSDTDMNYAWDGAKRDPLGATVDLSNYFNKSSDTSDSIVQGTTNLFVSTTEKSTRNGKQNALAAQTAYSAKGSATKVPQITTNNLGQVTGITEVAITQPDISGKQDTLTAGNLIDLTGNVVKNKALFVIKESDVTVSTDSTKGVSPYSTSYGYTNIDINASAGVERVEGALYTFVVNTKMVVASANRNVRVRIGAGTYLPVMNTSAILAGSSYFTKANIRYFQYTTKYQSGGALHLVTDSNTTYSAMTEAEITDGTGTTARTITPAMLKTAVKAYGNDTDATKGLQSFVLQSNSDAAATTKVFQTTAGVDTDYMNSLDSYILMIQFVKGNTASSFTFTIGSSTVTAMGMPVGSDLPVVDSYGSITFMVAKQGDNVLAIPVDWTSGVELDYPTLSAADIKDGTSTVQSVMTAAAMASALSRISPDSGNELTQLKHYKCTQAAYDAMSSHDANTIYYTYES